MKSNPDHLGRVTFRLFAWFLIIAFDVLFGIGAIAKVSAYEGCEPEPYHEHWSPTEIKGCVVYGEGLASHWVGPGVARNDCVFPWTACTPIIITSPETGKQIFVIPAMFCDCYTGTRDERIVDLDPSALIALGLETPETIREHRTRGLYPVVVEPWGAETPPTLLPDTATR